MQHRPEIDGLRAVAVIPVVLFHAGLNVFSGGYVGVDVFFVISGFLITGLIKEDLEAGRFSILGFYNRRIRRILPALVATALLTSVAAFALLLPELLQDFSQSLVSVAGFASNFYFWQTSGYFANDALLRPMLHTWSLSVEEQFYVFMPIAAFAVFHFFGRRWRLALGAAALASLALSIFATTVGPTANFFLLPTRAWELLVGALLAVIPRAREGRPILAQTMSLVGLALIAWAVFTYDETTPFPGAMALAPCLGAAFCIYFADPERTLVGRFLTLKPMIWIGLISYSLYLVHWPIAVFWRYITLALPDIWGACAIAALSVLAGALSWRFVEQPFRGKKSASNLQVIGVGIAALALLGGIGAAGWASSGLPQRFANLPPRESGDANMWRNGVCFLSADQAHTAWNAEACAINPAGTEPALLWGDSFAAHYAPGIAAQVRGSHWRVYQYTSAGCPPALTYESYARRHCRPFNQNALAIIDQLNIKRVILAARWVDLRSRGLAQLRSTLEALAERDVEVYVVGQSPMFITDVAVIAARQSTEDSWPISVDASINDNLRELAIGATFIDPLEALCDGARCPFRRDWRLLYTDYGHFSEIGSTISARAYLPLSEERVSAPAP